ncbi:MAG: ABC transporter permease [Oscillospiraceae bacterium]|nr:ABC transporter permease [Oscillospiraceae bacterium]
MKVVKKILRQREIGILAPLLLLWLITYFANHAFFSVTNMVSLFRNVSITLLGVIGATFVFSCGMMDLSAGSLYGLAGMIAAICMKDYGMPVPVSILLALIVGALFGMLNGVIVNTLDIPAFIATLGTNYIARGAVNVISLGKAYTGFPDSFNNLGGLGLFGIPWSVYIALVLAVAAALVLKYTIYGRSLLAVGGNAETARTCGIPIRRVRNIAFVIMAVLCSMSGILATARLETAQATAGTGWEMTVVAAAIIGGVSMYGGSASVLGAAIGTAIMETLTISMTMLKVNPYWQRVVVGVVIVLAVGMDTYQRKKLSGGKG